VTEKVGEIGEQFRRASPHDGREIVEQRWQKFGKKASTRTRPVREAVRKMLDRVAVGKTHGLHVEAHAYEISSIEQGVSGCLTDRGVLWVL
jgi:hypothetical protein